MISMRMAFPVGGPGRLSWGVGCRSVQMLPCSSMPRPQ